MYKGQTVAVVVPAYNEEKLIARVIETMPDFIDRIVVVNDASEDATSTIVEGYKSKLGERVVLIDHEKNEGVGGAIVTGYKWVRDRGLDIAVVMAGDAQMDPTELPTLLDPIGEGLADYVKGNRLFTGDAWKLIPRYRYLGNSVLSLLTKAASGYWHVADSQCGYTAASSKMLRTMDLDNIYKRYGMPNDLLARLNIFNFRVKDVPVKPIYNIGEKSGIRIRKDTFSIAFLLLRLFFWRLLHKYIIRDFHPLVFFYLLGIPLLLLGGLFGAYLMLYRIFIGRVAVTSALFVSLLTISGLQFILFAMWFDMEYNRDLANK